jgi:hypothetical protein
MHGVYCITVDAFSLQAHTSACVDISYKSSANVAELTCVTERGTALIVMFVVVLCITCYQANLLTLKTAAAC